ncbi:MAG: iron export ABC transporter permease subunit FetB [Planctomycetales bacterium]|nr:iron export ABC transporter permease subunit FetB [Planctomycetales bacterium]NIM07624.1 iron export ABC transporter permease subunit FetB [Planctomycetales bacterium]NIN07130.1 iron export ABC transporter permease subunit FetB [Planctomycetales bacterium]NIN76224.1 iron export ABC transporter permease subunit FetB [Planctomycetales bacterium]NIO33446.1 iron export ABC transporter permease subunit FetB [Planctomycetales bacterium]
MLNPTYIELDASRVALAALLILVNGAISLALRLGMARTLLVASARTVVQLVLVGMVLQWVFGDRPWFVVLGLLMLMTFIAGVTAVQRNQRRYPGIWTDTMISVWVSSWLITSFALLVVIRDMQPWYQPRYAIPLLGMVLGNTLNGISLGMNALTEALVTRRDEVESLLALGASRWEAAAAAVRHAVRTGMVPIVNAMMVVGVVSLPGMMTGQILAQAEPLQAVKYQIVIMFLVASATGLGTVGVILLGYRRLFNADHQFLYDQISE